jgi:hypothetical protein
VILVPRETLKRLKFRDKYIADYAYEQSIKNVAELNVKEIAALEAQEDEQWSELLRKSTKTASG